MIDQILSPEVQSFIEKHLQDDANDLRLKYKTIFDIPANVVIDQISGRKKAKEKLPSWYALKRIIYPPSLNLEQSSSERTGLKKEKVVESLNGISRDPSKILDLTGGFGVDSFFLSKTCKELHFVEPNEQLLGIARHNHTVLGAQNIIYHNTTAEEFLNALSSTTFNLIYADPSRRLKQGQKVFSLRQCEPDVLTLQHKMFQFTDNLLLKTSPLLDIKLGLSELQDVKKIFIISVYNECKEVLFLCEKNAITEPSIEAINLEDEEHLFSFSISSEELAEVKYSDPKAYLYEANASILKAGAFKSIGAHFQVCKLHPNTHLYTSDHLVDNFPGRIFRVDSFVKSDDKNLVKTFDDARANIFTRNYPLTVSELRKKTRLREGGNKFLIGCSGIKKKFLLVATKIR